MEEIGFPFKNPDSGYHLEIPGFQVGAPIISVTWSENKKTVSARYAVVPGRLVQDPIDPKSQPWVGEFTVFVDESWYNPAYVHWCANSDNPQPHLYWSKYVQLLKSENQMKQEIPGTNPDIPFMQSTLANLVFN